MTVLHGFKSFNRFQSFMTFKKRTHHGVHRSCSRMFRSVQIVQSVQVVQRKPYASDGLNVLNGLNYLNRLRQDSMCPCRLFPVCAVNHTEA